MFTNIRMPIKIPIKAIKGIKLLYSGRYLLRNSIPVCNSLKAPKTARIKAIIPTSSMISPLLYPV
jgi:hypothetical protein